MDARARASACNARVYPSASKSAAVYVLVAQLAGQRPRDDNALAVQVVQICDERGLMLARHVLCHLNALHPV